MPAFKPELTLAIGVTDLKRSANWYTGVLGLQQLYVVEEIGWGEFATPLAGASIGLGQSMNGEPVGGNGGACITFGVQDIDAVRTELEGNFFF
ncbi:MAG: VOC family protein, partial [Thermomicrobiales bacterium]|nr:VOC family protein [Thermomicrobiales bacterium]